MTYYERFRGVYDVEIERIHARRQAVIDKARELRPENLDDIVVAHEEDIPDHELAWVEVPNPFRPSEGDTVTARPVLGLTRGYEDAEREKDIADKGVWMLGIETRLPSGDIWYLGDIVFFYARGQLKNEPMVSISPEPGVSRGLGFVKWDSADAELFLTLAESALDAQP